MDRKNLQRYSSGHAQRARRRARFLQPKNSLKPVFESLEQRCMLALSVPGPLPNVELDHVGPTASANFGGQPLTSYQSVNAATFANTSPWLRSPERGETGAGFSPSRSATSEIIPEGESSAADALLYVGIAHRATSSSDNTASPTNPGLLAFVDVAGGTSTPWHSPYSSPLASNRLLPGVGFSGLAFLPDGRLFAITTSGPGSINELVQLDPITGDILSRVTLAGGLTNVSDLAVHPLDGALYGIRSGENGSPIQLLVINPETGQTVGTATPASVTGLQRAYGLAFDNTGTLFVSGTATDGRAVLFNGQTGTLLNTSETLIGLAVEPGSGRLIASRANRDEPAWINPSTGVLTVISLNEPPHGAPGDLAFHPSLRSQHIQTIFQRDFEDGPGGFTTDNSGRTLPGLWHYSIGRYADGLPNHTPLHSWYYGVHETSIGTGTYVLPASHKGVLISPTISIPSCGSSVLSFSYLLATRPELNRDFVFVSVEYVDEFNVNQVVQILSRSDNTLVQTGNRWLTATADLSAFAGRDIRVTFTFDTGDIVRIDPEGWYVDDVLISQIPVPGCDPAITVEKSSPATSYDAVGDVIPYQYLITNTGNVALPGPFTVDDNLATDETCPAVTLLAPGNTITCTASYTITQADLDAGSVTNTVQVTTTFDGNPVLSPIDTLTIPAIQNPVLALEKTSTTASYDSVGDVIDYQFVVTNSGNVTIRDAITIQDATATNVVCPASTALAPTQSITCTASYTVVQADLDAGSVINTARATTTFNGLPVESLPDSVTVGADQDMSLSVQKSADVPSYDSVGDVISYQYFVTNNGNVTLQGPITIQDDRISNVTCPGDVTLAPTSSITCTATYTITQADLDAGSVTNSARGFAAFESAPVESPAATVTVPAIQQAALVLDKTASGTFTSLGDVIAYQYQVTNTGNVTLQGPITIQDDRIATVTCSAVTNLAPAESITCTANYSVTQADLDAGFITNIAQASALFGTAPVLSPPDSATVTGTVEPRLSLEKSANVATYESVGAVILYEYTLTNTGGRTLSGPFTIDDDRVTDENCPATTSLAPGEQILCTASYTVTQADLDAGFITNVARATSTLDGAPILSEPDTVTVTANQNPGLSVEKSATAGVFDEPGDVITYTYVITNTGNVTINGPVGVQDDRIAEVVCPTTATLAPGQTVTCSATYTVTQADLDAGSITNTAHGSGTFDGDTIQSPPDSVTVTVEQTPELTVEKSTLTTSYDSVGDVIEYSYVITNTGNVTIGGPFVVEDDRTTNETCPADATLAPQSSITCTSTYTITQADLDAGSVTNSATVSGGFNNSPVISPPDTVTIPAVQTPALALVKSGNPPTYDSVGDVINYQFQISNTGNVTLPGPFTVADDRASDETCPATDPLAPGATITCTASYTITQADLDSGSVTNTAIAGGSFNGSPVASPEATFTVNSTAPRALTISKTATVTTYDSVGDILGYQFVVTNTGSVTVDGPFTIDDNRATDESCPATESLAPGASILCTATYTVTQADLDAGFVTNSATASGSINGNPVTSAPDTETVTAEQESELSVEKSVLNSNFSFVGEVIHYRYVLTNVGNVTLVGPFTIEDDRTTNETCPATASLAPGASITCTSSYVITQADLDAGAVTNVATGIGSFEETPVESPPDSVTLTAQQTVQFVSPLSVYRPDGPFVKPPASQIAISGYVWHDQDDDGVWDGSELGLNGWTVYLDDNNNSVLDAGESAFPTTNDGVHDGAFWFTKQQATPGTYTVRTVRPADVTSKFPSGPGFSHSVTVSANQSIIGAFGQAAAPNFGNSKSISTTNGALQGFKWHDLDRDGVWDSNEEGRAGFRVYLDLNGNNVFDAFDPADPTKGPEPFAVTGANGFFAFANLVPGTYTLRDDRLPLTSGTFRVQSFPDFVPSATQDSDEHRVTIAAGQTISGPLGTAAIPNFGVSEYSPLVRPADDHLGHALRLSSGNDLLAALASWQSVEIRNTTGAPFQITSIDESSIAAPGPSLVQVLRCDGSPLALPISVPANGSVEFCAFYDPAVRSANGNTVLEQYPDWFGGSSQNPPHTFGPNDRLNIVTNAGISFPIKLVGGSTYDSDIAVDGIVSVPDLGLLDDTLLKETSPILDGVSPNFDPTLDINARCPNGAQGVVGACEWALTGTPRREISLGDYSPLNVEWLRARAPFLELDADDSSGAKGTDFVITYGGDGVAVADADARFANQITLELESLEVSIQNPVDGTSERLVFRGQQGHSIVISNLGSKTIGEFNQILREIEYVNSEVTPTADPRVIVFTPRGGDEFAQAVGNQPRATVLFPNAVPNSPITETGGESESAALTDDPSAALLFRWQNSANRFDVNGIDGVTPLDVLALINYINRSSESAYLPDAQGQLAFLDVTGDDWCTVLDVLALINHLNSGGSVQAEGESGAFSAPVTSSNLASDPADLELVSDLEREAQIDSDRIRSGVSQIVAPRTVHTDFKEALVGPMDDLFATEDFGRRFDTGMIDMDDVLTTVVDDILNARTR